MPTRIEDVLKKARPRETTVPVFMAGDVVAEIERLERQLADVGDWQADSLAGTNPAQGIAEKIAAAHKKLAASEVEFRFRALPDWSDDPDVTTWSDLLAAHPARNDKEMFNAETLPRELIAACCVDPVMTPEQVDRLCIPLNLAQRNALFDGAWSVNTQGTTALPFSVTASAILAALGGAK